MCSTGKLLHICNIGLLVIAPHMTKQCMLSCRNLRYLEAKSIQALLCGAEMNQKNLV